MKRPYWACCKSVFLEANHLSGAIWPNWFAPRARPIFTPTSSRAALAWMMIACARCTMQASIPSS